MKKILLYGLPVRSSKGMGWIPKERVILSNVCREARVTWSKGAYLLILHPMIELFVRL